MDVHCKPSLDKLTAKETVALLHTLHPEERSTAKFFHDSEHLVELSLLNLVNSPADQVAREGEPWRRRYMHWARHHLVRVKASLDSTREGPGMGDISQLLKDAEEKVRHVNLVGRVYALVSRHLMTMLQGDVNPLELLLQSGQLTPLYDEMLVSNSVSKAMSYVDLLAHQRPGMNILEVGVGTGAGTRLILNALLACPGDSTGFLRCNRYTFTDISRAMFPQVQEEFKQHEPSMSFRSLDIDPLLTEQVLKEGEFDLIIAVSVLHVSANLENTLRNMRSALRPGGTLLIQEVFEPSGWTLGFVFGLLSGWWHGVSDERVLSPNIVVEEWDTVLKRSGFSGADIVLRDTEQSTTRDFGWIVTTAAKDEAAAPVETQSPQAQSTIIINDAVPKKRALAEDVKSPFENLVGMTPQSLSVQAAARREGGTEAVTIS
ncbi:S-adenosyl-L-methionine-dependent methyltransferase [Xylariaceae sp. FL0662B]|nr:S-adenosyl-L-methionine-dependent methyltransferase [Xylariaceae sp. FL0662B]